MAIIQRGLKKINKTLSPGKLFFAPQYIVLGVNNVCNLHCKMCDVGTQNLETNFAQNLIGSHPLNMPLELFEKIVDQTATFFPGAKLGYAFTEPLVYPHLAESLLMAKKRGVKTTITTNALNLKRKADAIIAGEVEELFISIDGLQDTHNYIRGNKNSFQKAVEGIQHLQGYENPPKISVYCVITEWNYTELLEFANYFNELPIEKVGFMHQNFVTEALAESHNAIYGNRYSATHSNIEETDMSKIDLNLLHDTITEIKSKDYKIDITFSPEIDDRDVLETFYLKPDQKLGRTCNDVFTNLMVKTDGSIIPAHGRCYNVSMGNMYEHTLQEIWNDGPYAQFRKDLVKAGGLFPACNRCCSAF